MYPRGSLATAGTIDALVARLNALRPNSPKQWGRMTQAQMLCHLSDSFLVSLGERAAPSAESALSRTVVKFIALHTPLPWPKGVPTTSTVDAMQGGTRPAEFEADRQRVIELLRRFTDPGAAYARHPGFGPLSRSEWMMWGFAHIDHHLRQFSC